MRVGEEFLDEPEGPPEIEPQSADEQIENEDIYGANGVKHEFLPTVRLEGLKRSPAQTTNPC